MASTKHKKPESNDEQTPHSTRASLEEPRITGRETPFGHECYHSHNCDLGGKSNGDLEALETGLRNWGIAENAGSSWNLRLYFSQWEDMNVPSAVDAFEPQLDAEEQNMNLTSISNIVLEPRQTGRLADLGSKQDLTFGRTERTGHGVTQNPHEITLAINPQLPSVGCMDKPLTKPWMEPLGCFYSSLDTECSQLGDDLQWSDLESDKNVEQAYHKALRNTIHSERKVAWGEDSDTQTPPGLFSVPTQMPAPPSMSPLSLSSQDVVPEAAQITQPSNTIERPPTPIPALQSTMPRAPRWKPIFAPITTAPFMLISRDDEETTLPPLVADRTVYGHDYNSFHCSPSKLPPQLQAPPAISRHFCSERLKTIQHDILAPEDLCQRTKGLVEEAPCNKCNESAPPKSSTFTLDPDLDRAPNALDQLWRKATCQAEGVPNNKGVEGADRT